MFDCAAYIMLRYVVHAFILSACSMSIIMHVLAVLHYFMSCMQSLICVCSIQISHNVRHVNGVSVLRCVLLCCMHHCVVLCMRS